MHSAGGVGGFAKPSRQMENTKPVADYDSKTVMLRAERKDRIRVTDVCEQYTDQDNIPTQFTVAQRTDTYFGPKLLLDSGDELFQLTAPGPDTYLLLWKLDPPTEQTKQRWAKVAEVKADFDGEPPAYNICVDCGEPIQTAEHERLSLIGRCPN